MSDIISTSVSAAVIFSVLDSFGCPPNRKDMFSFGTERSYGVRSRRWLERVDCGFPLGVLAPEFLVMHVRGSAGISNPRCEFLQSEKPTDGSRVMIAGS